MRIVQITTDNREQFKNYDSSDPCFGAAPEALLEGFSKINAAEIHVVSCLRQEVSSPSVIYGNIHYHSVVVPKAGWMSSFYRGCIKATRSLIQDLQPDIVHGQGTERDCAMCATHSGFPNVLTIHGNVAELNRLGINYQKHRLFGYLAARLETHAMRRTNGVFCNSAYTKSLVAPRTMRTWLIPNAIRSGFFKESTRNESPPPVPRLLNVGHLGERKRHLEILRMATAIHELGFKFLLMFAGAVNEETDYNRAFVEELKRAEQLGYATHIGFLDTAALVDLMDEVQGFIHFPSEEAFGLVVAEALARGLKFFGSDVGGITEIASGIPGVELYSDFENLQDAVTRWLSAGAHPVTEASETVKNLYAPEAVAEMHLEIYRELASL